MKSTTRVIFTLNTVMVVQIIYTGQNDILMCAECAMNITIEIFTLPDCWSEREDADCAGPLPVIFADLDRGNEQRSCQVSAAMKPFWPARDKSRTCVRTLLRQQTRPVAS